ncbi:MAG: phosphomethylpyrimidine synthase ThiC, partial [Chloroflexi bacterium]|nr:phosphomethylpyrimidine synthase ThiC [Chloroflexota bacterium]
TIAKKENVSEDFIRRGVANGRIIIPSNTNREVKPVGIGEGLRTKVNATIGTSTDIVDLKMEEEKAEIAIKNKADTLMELSVGGDLDKIRKRILEISPIPVGSVP